MKKRLLWAAAISWAAAGWLAGQAVHARIDGYVQDEEGRFLARVEVTATNVVSNAETKVMSDRGNGGFRFLGLAPGTYQVSCDLEGYESYVAGGIRLSAGESTTLRVKLKRLPGTEPPPPDAAAPEDAQGPWKRWQVELAIGGFSHAPDDLNLIVDRNQWLAKERYFLYLQDPRFIQIPFIGSGLGVIHSLSGRFPLTFRLRLHANRTLSWAAGIDWTDQQRESHYLSGASFTERDSGARFDVQTEVSGFRLGLETFFPHLGAQVSLPLNPYVGLSGFLHAGWAFASFRHSSRRHFQDGFSGENRLHEAALSGKGNGPGVEGGAKFEFILRRGFGLFVEGVYQLFKVGNVSGEGVTSETILDEGAGGAVIRQESKGRWRISNNAIPWPLIPAADMAEFYRAFSLDLGGAGFRIGAYFRF